MNYGYIVLRTIPNLLLRKSVTLTGRVSFESHLPPISDTSGGKRTK